MSKAVDLDKLAAQAAEHLPRLEAQLAVTPSGRARLSLLWRIGMMKELLRG